MFMLFRSPVWLILLVLLLGSLSPDVPAESQTLLKNSATNTPTKTTKDLRVIDGFRSAKFGMNEKQVRQAIAKDFKAYESTLNRKLNFAEKTTVLVIHNPKLLEIGGGADIGYIMGFKSKKLIQVSIEWGKGVDENFSPDDMLAISNELRNHFLKKKFKKLEAVNQKIDDIRILVFRGQDEKGRTIILGLTIPKGKDGETLKDVKKNMSLVLHYILNPENPDLSLSKAK
jgi:hypothetical protein